MTNLQGDVLAILDSSKQVVASYSHDPYGKVLSATGTLAEVNPLRYRGYVYDQETGFYYLQSRYYDPTTCRFINADSVILTEFGIVGYNQYTYCINNPVRYHDACGYMPEEDCITEDPEEYLIPDKDALGQPRQQGSNNNPYGYSENRSQLRSNMLAQRPAPGSNYQAHHGLPWGYREYFWRAGIDISDPMYGRWVVGGGNGGHQSWSYRYNKIWENYIDRHPTPNKNDIIDYFNKLNGGK